MRRLWWIVSLNVLSVGCVSGDNPFVCDEPTCGDGGSDGGTTGGTDGGRDGGSGNPDGGCTESWTCSYWQPTDGGTAVRTCADLNGCGTTTSRPNQGPIALPALDLNFYKCNVQPVLARSCAMVGCHGTLSPDRPLRVFARGRQRNNEIVPYTPSTYGCGTGSTVNINLAIEASGTASCPAKVKLTGTEWALNFDNQRAFALGISSPDSSELLAQPTRGTAFTHAGIKPWTVSSAEYQMVRSWLNGQTLATCNTGSN